MTGANATTGGALFGVTPASMLNNPALTAFNQRIALDAAGTMLYDTGDSAHPFGGAFQAGVLVPSKWCVATFLLQGVFVPVYDMQLGNSFNLTTGFSKDITDNVSVGTSVNVGLFYGYGTDWTVSGALGAFYRLGDAGFLRDVRFGAAVTNLGKMYTNTDVRGIKYHDVDCFSKFLGKTPTYADSWPGIATFRTGAAATLLQTDVLALGASVDVAFPAFQNFVADAGLALRIKDVVTFSSAWEFDAREFANGSRNLIPSVGISVKFVFNSKDGSYLTKKGWQQSDMTVSTAYRNLYGSVHAFSAGAVLDLGLQDTQPPEITLWGEK